MFLFKFLHDVRTQAAIKLRKKRFLCVRL